MFGSSGLVLPESTGGTADQSDSRCVQRGRKDAGTVVVKDAGTVVVKDAGTVVVKDAGTVSKT